MKTWLEISYFLVVALTVFFGYRKSRRFHQELQDVPDEIKEEHLRQRGRLGFWEAGAIRKLPFAVAVIGYLLAASALFVISVYLSAFGVAIYRGW